jgi:hypothetical protein
MISDSQFSKAKSSLYLDSCLTYLHETKGDFTSSILSGGLMLDKSYNGEISRVVKQAKTDDEIKEYNYYHDRKDKAIAVITVPKSILGDIDPNSLKGQLFLNCISQRIESKMPEGNWLHYTKPTFERLPSIIPSKWINGVFDEQGNFLENPAFILRMPDYKKQIEYSKQEILAEVKKRYPMQFSQMFSEFAKDNSMFKTQANDEPEK